MQGRRDNPPPSVPRFPGHSCHLVKAFSYRELLFIVFFYSPEMIRRLPKMLIVDFQNNALPPRFNIAQCCQGVLYFRRQVDSASRY